MKTLFLKQNSWILFLGIVWACQGKQETIQPQKKELIEAVYASGNTMPKNSYEVYATADGVLLEKLVQDGDIVEINQALFIIENDQQNIQQGNAQTNYQIARENYTNNSPIIREIEVSIETLRRKVSNDSLNFIRYRNLVSKGISTQADFEQAELKYETSKNELQLQKERLAKTKNQLYLELKNAESQYQLQSDRIGDYVIESLIEGKVYEVYKEVGELVRRNEPLALLGSPNAVHIELIVDELDIKRVKVGQEVLLQIDALGDETFEAKVSKIYPLLNPQNQSFRVDAQFLKAPKENFTGLTVEANIIIRKKKDALVIPKNYLLEGDSVWIQQGNDKQKIKVVKGIETLEEVEILQGLKISDLIVK